MSKERNVNYPSYVNKAEIRSDGKGYEENFRFILSIPFDTSGKNYLRVIMKNPSKADIAKCDNTVVKVCNAAYEAKYDGVVIMNLFPFRATKAEEVFEKYFRKQKRYKDTMKVNCDVIKIECVDKVVVFAWGTNTISNDKEFKNEYDNVSEKIQNIIISGCAIKAMAFGNNEKYPLHGLRWWKTIISESKETSE